MQRCPRGVCWHAALAVMHAKGAADCQLAPAHAHLKSVRCLSSSSSVTS